jgi:hypothetical protein
MSYKRKQEKTAGRIISVKFIQNSGLINVVVYKETKLTKCITEYYFPSISNATLKYLRQICRQNSCLCYKHSGINAFISSITIYNCPCKLHLHYFPILIKRTYYYSLRYKIRLLSTTPTNSIMTQQQCLCFPLKTGILTIAGFDMVNKLNSLL